MSRRIHPALTSAADEVCGTLARVIAYVMALALIGILGLSFWDQLPRLEAAEPTRIGWAVAGRSHPAYAVSHLDSDEKSETYEIVRHPEGGRKDIFRWASPGDRPVAELEIYRIGAEVDAGAGLSSRMPSAGASELEAAGIIDSKFGTVALLRPVGARDSAGACLGFLKRFDDPAMQISGWSCQGSSMVSRRAAVGCLLTRLTLLASGNEPKLGELFARAELKRGSCGNPALAAESADWVKRADSPRLRGAL
jgi:hypothetical protein